MLLSDLFSAGRRPNLLLVITDQERSVATWPAAYRPILASRLQAMQVLAGSGLTFANAFTGACMCSPSRATFLTSVYPVNTGCTQTARSVLPLPTYTPQFPTFPDGLPNLATVLGAAGYTCYWTGKWHLLGSGRPAMGDYPAIPAEPGDSSSDLVPWGFQRWDPADAGTTVGNTLLGGGTQGPAATNRNDPRYVADAIGFLSAPPNEPFCLVVSLVNPHDIHLGYQNQAAAYYDKATFEGTDVPAPGNIAGADLPTKPRMQAAWAWDEVANKDASQQDFMDLYAYLLGYADDQIGTILKSMDASALANTLIIRFADHGELGLSHGLVEKHNAYDEAIHIPMVFSNPQVWPEGQTTQAMASSIDLVPTLASLLGVASRFPGLAGADLTGVLDGTSSSVQEFVHFTFDESPDQPSAPGIIRAIRSTQWMYAVYMTSTSDGTGGDWEMYDLEADPSQDDNLAGNPAYAAQQAILDGELVSQMKQKGTMPSFSWPPTYVPGKSRGGPPPQAGT